jgi:hypothetical protein
VGRSLWRKDESVVYNCCWLSPAQSFSGPSPVALVTIFYCLRFEASLFVAPYDSQGYGGGIRHRLHTGFFCYIIYKIQFLPQRKHITSPLQSPTGFFILSEVRLSLLSTAATIGVRLNPLGTAATTGVRVNPLGTAATTCLLYQPRMIDDGDCGAIGGMKIGMGNRNTRRKPAPEPICPPQIPHDQTRASSQRLTAWAMARPSPAG